MKTFFTDTEVIAHMEADRYFSGKIIYSTGNHLRSTDGTRQYQEFVKNTPDLAISHFTQLNSTTILIVDKPRNCILLLNRLDRSLGVIAGKCSRFISSNAVGDGAKARFQSPTQILQDTFATTNYLISDNGNGCIKLLDVTTRKVSIFLNLKRTNQLERPTAMAWFNGALLVSLDDRIELLFVSRNYNRPASLIHRRTVAIVKDVKVIVASPLEGCFFFIQFQSHTLHILDRNKKLYDSLSFTQRPTQRPLSVLMRDESLYVGHFGGIVKTHG